jgi:periplasmic protein TonB
MQKLSPESAKPLVLTRGDPNYPPIAIAARLQGNVKIQIVVSPAGKPLSATTVSRPPMLIGAARDAIAGWRFKPLQIGTRAVAFQTDITFHFGTFGGPFAKLTSSP